MNQVTRQFRKIRRVPHELSRRRPLNITATPCFFTIHFSVSQGYRIQTLSWCRVWYISFIFLTWFVVNTVFLSHMCNSWLSFPRLIRSERKNNKQYVWFSAARSGWVETTWIKPIAFFRTFELHVFYVTQIPDAAVLEAARTNCGVVQEVYARHHYLQAEAKISLSLAQFRIQFLSVFSTPSFPHWKATHHKSSVDILREG